MIPSMMKAARLHAIGEFITEDIPVSAPHGKELLVKIGACGVCGSDLPRVFQSGSSNGKYPLTIGHEFAGTVAAVGEEADPSLIGRRGAFYPLIPCMQCPSCRSGNYAMCENYNYLGSRTDGGFAQYCLVPDAWHFVESENPAVSMETLAMTEPACVAQHAIRKSGMFPGAKVLIFGAGPIGIMAGRWAKLFGASEVLLIDVAEEKAAFARQHGMNAKVGWTEADGLWDITVEASGFGSALDSAIRAAKPFGNVTLLGNPAGDTAVSRQAHSLILRRELTLRGIWNSYFGDLPLNEWRYTMSMMDEGRFICDDLVTHQVSIEDVPNIITAMREKTVRTCKVLYVEETT